MRILISWVSFQLLATATDVAKMQEELEMMQPMLEEASKETVLTMEQIQKDTVRPSQDYINKINKIYKFIVKVKILFTSSYG